MGDLGKNKKMIAKQMNNEWNDDGFMIRLPTYNECFEQLVSYLGLDYDEGGTSAYKMNRIQDFYKLGNIYTNYYYPKILEIFDCKDENSKKYDFITSNLLTFESLVRFTSTKNYYSIASNKKVIWGILHLYYIPFIACAVSSYNKEFKLPNAFILNDFMLINLDRSQNESPIAKLKNYLKNIINNLSINKDSTENDESYKFLISSVDRLGENNKIPRYQTCQKIVRYLKRYETSEEKILEIYLIFRIGIFLEHIYSKFCNLFGVEYAIDLFKYFLICFKTCEKIQNKISYDSNDFTNFIYEFNDYYNFGSNLDEMLNKYEENRVEVLCSFELFVNSTKINNKNDLEDIIKYTSGESYHYFKINTMEYSQDIDTWDKDNLDIIDLISELEYKLTVDEDHQTTNGQYILNNDEIKLLFTKIENHKFFNYYCHEYLYLSALNDLAKNEFSAALDKLNNVADICKKITAGETLLKTAKLLIVLTFFINPKITYSKTGKNNYSHLNSYVDMIILSEPEQLNYSVIQEDEFIVVNPSKKECSTSAKIPFNSDNIVDENQFKKDVIKQTYLMKIIRILIDFNKTGYCCYENFKCEKYNPFVKLECLICQFYQFYDCYTQEFESEEQKINAIFKQIIKNTKPKYNIQDDNLVTLYQYKAIDVFKYNNFVDISFFCVESQLNCENILKLGADQKMLSIIHKVVQDLSKKKRGNTN